MNRAEARSRLQDSTSFQFVGDKVLLRSVALIEALRQVQNEHVVTAANPERDVASEPTLVLAA